ncbi:hypothetical protein EMIHUDRAFT_465064 [Emiliania huxleyi CCMP1516]|uniref:Transmembrane protein n=2 Tax=Emiliania huxleyi TaxID=2903 RepID=A0A0D3IJA1_EMIH1|nr:hypothetical protein EMIHUDRAFT_465064 [Emiliania huxleyi CCMP1516]EOD11336.1 hypothetical protein EMIHUDRAFT_465064 [Emiliania huxleyi CCMP1516]|eukprot:XP_005763765.1 hypothetical protein EMIHUDRAFT_465064 [Emiliania huxleyi CCMP1516]
MSSLKVQLTQAAAPSPPSISFVERYKVAVEARINLKHVHRRLQVVAKLLIVATFVEDALRMLFKFDQQQQSMEIAGWTSPALHTLLPLMSLAVQSCGALLVLASSGVGGEVGCYLLLGWCVWHPFMYGQAGNREFVLETATISGGLLILLSHLLLLRTKAPLLGESGPGAVGTPARVQAVGRVLLVSFFLSFALSLAHAWAVSLPLGAGDGPGVWGRGTQAVELVLSLLVLSLCGLVVLGMKSRHVALLLAAAVFAAAVSVTAANVVTLLLHSSDTFPVEDTAGMEGVEADAATIADHHRYFFFQSMSTVGALLLLVVHGPGALSVDEQDGPIKIASEKAEA